MFVRTSYWETFLCFFVLYAYLCVCVTGKDRKGGMPRERLYRPIPENIVINTVTFTMTSVVMEKSACYIPGSIDECWKYPTPWMHLSKMQYKEAVKKNKESIH